MSNVKLLLILILFLLAGNIFFGAQYLIVQQELRDTKAALTTQKINDRVFVFAQLFVEKVLQAEQEVDFETRLQLENAVRTIGDEEILMRWQQFTESETEEQAQTEVKNLLSLLIKKIESGGE